MGGLPVQAEAPEQSRPHSSGQTNEYRPAGDTSTTDEVSDSGTRSILVEVPL